MEVIPRGPVPPSRRLINLEMKKLRKLKNELMDKYGKKVRKLNIYIFRTSKQLIV